MFSMLICKNVHDYLLFLWICHYRWHSTDDVLTGWYCLLLLSSCFILSSPVISCFFLFFSHCSPRVVAKFLLLSLCFFVILLCPPKFHPDFIVILLVDIVFHDQQLVDDVLPCFPLFSSCLSCLPPCLILSSLFFHCCPPCLSARWWCPPWYLIRIAAILLTVWSCPVKHVYLHLLLLMIWWSLFLSF